MHFAECSGRNPRCAFGVTYVYPTWLAFLTRYETLQWNQQPLGVFLWAAGSCIHRDEPFFGVSLRDLHPHT